MARTPPLSEPGNRNTNRPTEPLGVPPPGEIVTPSPLITPPEDEELRRPPITPPVSSPPPQGSPEGQGPPTGTINEPPVKGFYKKLQTEDYDKLFKMLDDLRSRGQVPKPQEKNRLFYQPSKIRHVKGGPGNNVLAPDEDFAIEPITFPRHPDAPQSDEFFDKMFSEAYSIVLHFVIDNFGRINIKPDELGGEHPWNDINVSALFIGVVEHVEDSYPDDPKGWDSLLLDSTKRSMMIEGIIARIFMDKVFSPLLFGCTAAQSNLLNVLEQDMAENAMLDGFARTKARSKAIREILDGDAVSRHFYDEVEQLSLNIFGLLNPVSAYLEKYALKHPNLGLSIPSRSEQFASLFSMVSGTAWLSICRRVHPDPIIIRMSAPGDKFNKDFDVCMNYEEYSQNRARILKLQYDYIEQEMARELRLREHGATNAAGTTNDGKVLPDSDILNDRANLIKTATWPSIKLYSPVHGSGPGSQSGVTDFTIQTCDVCCHWAVPRDYRAPTVELREWAKLK